MENVRRIFTREAEYKCRDCNKTIESCSTAYKTTESEETICEKCYQNNYDYRVIVED